MEQLDLLLNIEIPHAKVLSEVELNGFKVNQKLLSNYIYYEDDDGLFKSIIASFASS